MVGPPVPPPPVVSPIYLVGQAPGPHEASLGRPFAWTAGRTLFKWFATLGVDEPTFRARVYMAAVCRCFPGKASSGGDRVPSADEIANCSTWRARELELLDPTLIVPVGRLAIGLFLGNLPLVEVIGRTLSHDGRDVIALPHPSGVSTWFKTEPGASLTRQALARIGEHPAWQATFATGGSPRT
jgi:uracil-DNA glycosylase